jgi:DUF971 family protein
MRPSIILNDLENRTLTLTWGDGQVQELQHCVLRAACLCAFCRSKRLKSEIKSDPTSEITEIHSQGYGLQLVFNDGHDRGIYPWQYLKGMHLNSGTML